MSSSSERQLRSWFSHKHFQFHRMFGGYELRPSGEVYAVFTRPDNRTFWTQSSQGFQLWDATNGRQLRRLDLSANFASVHESWLWLVNSSGFYQHGKTTKIVREAERDIVQVSFDQKHENVLVTTKKEVLLLPVMGSSRRSFQLGDFQQAWLSPSGLHLLVLRKNVLQLIDAAQSQLWSTPLHSPASVLAFLSDSVLVSDGLFLRSLLWLDGSESWRVQLSKKPLKKIVTSENHIAASDGEEIFILDSSGTLIKTLAGKPPFSLSPDASWLVHIENQHNIKIVDLPSGKERLLGDGHTAPVTSLSWRNAEQVVSIANGEVRASHIKTGESEVVAELPGINYGRCSADGSLFTFDHGVVHQQTIHGEKLASYQREGQKISSFLISKGGTYLITRSSKEMHGWRVGDREPLWTKEIPLGLLSFNSNSEEDRFWCVTRDELLQFDIPTGQRRHRVPAEYEHSIEFSMSLEDRETAISLVSSIDNNGYGYSSSLRRINLETQKVLWSSYSSEIKSLYGSLRCKWHMILSGDRITFFRTANHAEIGSLSLQKLNDTPEKVSVSPDERFVAVGTKRGIVLVFSLQGELAPSM